MNLDNQQNECSEYDSEYKNKKENLSKKRKELFDIMVEKGVVNSLNAIKKNPHEIYNIMYKRKDNDQKHNNLKKTKSLLFEEFLGKKKGEKNNSSRDNDFINYIKANEPDILNPKCEKHENNEHKNENLSTHSERNLDKERNDFMESNPIALEFINSILRGRGNFSKTSYYIEEKNGIISAICMTIDGEPLQVDFNLNDYVANINGNLEWLQNGNYADSCTNCRVEKDGNNAYLVCDCPKRDGYMNKSRLNLDKRIDNINGNLWYVPQLTTNHS